MNKRILLIVGGLIGLVIIAAVGWYLVSPLFIDNTVDEAFPFDLPDQAELEAMSGLEMKELETEFMAAVPSEEEVAGLSPETQAQVVDRVMVAAAVVMTDKEIDETMMAETANAEWVVAAQGQFEGADSFHQGSGRATIFQQGEARALRFEDFSVTNGPDLHVILTKHPAPTSRAEVGSDYIDLGQLKGNIGNQNYEIPADIDLSEYQSIVIYCMPFHVVFSTATLS
jgi:hypothetical protein